MNRPIAYDVRKKEIKRGDLVRIVKESSVKHAWLKVGNTLRVSSWEDRSFGVDPFVCVFLKSKNGYNHCKMGIEDGNLEIIPE